ncbi:helix-turn-helix domain-containing protein [Pollutibacter soli]|uniref:helix-turn-helix domain-containing protein n=1 Tax=Pollutibacter soli TaxID=3034157 RepID=UPI0030134183
MYYRKYKPCNDLDNYVECYFVWDSEGSMDTSMIVESPPNGFCSIVFNYGNQYSLTNKRYERLNVPMQFVSGQNIYSFKLFLQGRIGIAGIVFRPAALSTIFNLPMYELVEDRLDLYKIFKRELVDKYVHAIEGSASEKEKVNQLEDFILHQVHILKPEPDYIDEAANFIVQHNGMLEVSDLLKNSCMSRRTFERKFFQKVGLSPKYYARIRRIAYLCNLIAGKKKVDWAKIFYECNYYDHAHFIKDFEEFTGRTPNQYLQENTELANYVEKSHQQN